MSELKWTEKVPKPDGKVYLFRNKNIPERVSVVSEILKKRDPAELRGYEFAGPIEIDEPDEPMLTLPKNFSCLMKEEPAILTDRGECFSKSNQHNNLFLRYQVYSQTSVFCDDDLDRLIDKCNLSYIREVTQPRGKR